MLDERYGLTITEDAGREDISNHVDHVAAMMRIGRQAAKRYVTDDVISDMADRIGRHVSRVLTREALQPGRDSHLRIVR
ncbi:hypothetical protein [Mycobacterium sp. NAZ190054]|uniref:hypothetical protein n=1 Tax=Mycobacterium sp. NAZ190054 TaxID=1747766 RepID=UPI001E473E68|nr:hypothetical protein [Mycobacterium sp. NAZ190054]